MSIIAVKCFRLITISRLILPFIEAKPFIRSYLLTHDENRDIEIFLPKSFYEKNKKAFNFDEDDAIRLYNQQKVWMMEQA